MKKIILLKSVNGEKHFFQENQVVNDEAHLAVPIETAGYYFIAINQMVQYPVYLKPGDEVNLNIYNDRFEHNGVGAVNHYLAAFFKKRMDLLIELLGKEIVYEDILDKINQFEAEQLELLKGLEDDAEFCQIQKEYIRAVAAEYRMRIVVMPNNINNEREKNKAFWTTEFEKINLNEIPIADLPNGLMLAGVYESFAQFIVGVDKSFEATLNQFSDKHKQSMLIMNRIKRFRIYDNNVQAFIEQYQDNISEKDMEYIEQWKAKFEAISSGKEVPCFELLNSQNEVVKLSEFKGKWVYIDLWATWCGPCKHEMPHFKTLAEQYKNSPIAFVAVSLDQDVKTWVKYLENKTTRDVYHLFGGNGFDSAIASFFKVSGVPRFILLDTKGCIVENNMSRPSEAKTKKVLDELLGI